jgi:(1->4)-alpha-D-glucan 1-alpha-D-glucosylmutase
VRGNAAPDANEEYLFYQTLVGVWPHESTSHEPVPAGMQDRLKAYMQKALREARLHSSWVVPDGEYEEAVLSFVESVLDAKRSPAFIADLERTQRVTATCGIWNSLSQLVLKITSPGVPDFYQGSELWQLQLVDPDNRQPVDYDTRLRLWHTLPDPASGDPSLVRTLLEQPADGRIKMFMTARLLQLRNRNAALFHEGAYVPLDVRGARQRNVVAFARVHGVAHVVVVAGRFFSQLRSTLPASPPGIPADRWGDTELRIPVALQGGFRDVLTGRTVHSRNGLLDLGRALNGLPATVLVGGSASFSGNASGGGQRRSGFVR